MYVLLLLHVSSSYDHNLWYHNHMHPWKCHLFIVYIYRVLNVHAVNYLPDCTYKASMHGTFLSLYSLYNSSHIIIGWKERLLLRF